ncbi:glucosamine-6-phosphate deaminase [Microbacterium halophytorum]|uniref:glucosamine-6-phosphate deaminase n=1 Tax=Microbacterium halophytorum TaxID=2067568 RepID=UPI000CFC5C8D|nr:glucosamine-6-phosphate deaminase [Microbacterium halophytorum]
MQVIVVENAQAVGEYVADTIIRRIEKGVLKVLGVATGSSPVPVYEALERRGVPSPQTLKAFALDEYVGLPKAHPESYHSVIERDVTRRLGLDPANVRVPEGDSDDIEHAGARYEQAIREAGGVDLQILGIGATGHIGFNEPTSSLSSRTRIKTLTPQTRKDNARFFDSPDEVPQHCLTQGLGTIMDAREVVLVAHGASKADAVAAAIEGPVSSMCPGSVLQFHENASFVVDEAAAAKLTLREYYDFTVQNRPEWQR